MFVFIFVSLLCVNLAIFALSPLYESSNYICVIFNLLWVFAYDAKGLMQTKFSVLWENFFVVSMSHFWYTSFWNDPSICFGIRSPQLKIRFCTSVCIKRRAIYLGFWSEGVLTPPLLITLFTMSAFYHLAAAMLVYFPFCLDRQWNSNSIVNCITFKSWQWSLNM